MNEKARRCVVLGVTGGIACYKSCELVSRLNKAGIDVYVIMTENATKLVQPLTFQTLSKHPVALDTFQPINAFEVEHIALAQRADLFVIAPATANILAKLAHGIADDMLSTTALATKAPMLVAPAMNTGMWENPATQENIRILKGRGVHLCGPEGGLLACGDSGMGRMSEPADIAEAVLSLLNRQEALSGVKVLVTAGPTREPVDPVRYITNRSSGKMGYALAQTAADMGADVTLVSGPVSLTPPNGVRVLPVETTEDLLKVMQAEAPAQDIIIQAAAPADYRPREVAGQKIKKQGGESFTLVMAETPDVAKAVGQARRADQFIAGFAAETENLTEHAMEKLSRKNLDMIIANDVTRPGAGFDVDTNIITVITREGAKEFPMMSKKDAAKVIFEEILAARNAGGAHCTPK
ncbi:MAG: bifunctional phosphopantothenoylcysteine decarboxylase/phosphopantothenate--cysteine ligase CoaBC [Clostridia bacterium]|nr:bifunctional phosphopantothenoylcysteine decarboxylase/phosphopantothenate--cysteine ligase CoaBC [Clostridia bacterium]